MRQVLAVASFDDTFERFCDAVLHLRRLTVEDPTLEPVGGVPVLGAAAAGRSTGTAAAVLRAPESHEPATSQIGFLRDVKRLRGTARGLPLLVAVGDRPLCEVPGIGGVDDAVRVLRRLGVDEVIVQPDEGTSLTVAMRLERIMLDPFALDFLRVLASELPPELWFVLRRMLQESKDGVAPTDRQLAESCGLELDRIRISLERLGAGSLGVWRERVALYGAVRRRAVDAAGPLRSGPDACPPDALERSCRRLTGIGLSDFLGSDGWRRLLAALAERMRKDAAAPTAHRPDDVAVAPVAEPAASAGVFTELMRKHRGAAFGAACRVLQCEDQAADVVQDVFVRVWEMGPERWPKISGAYLIRAARNRALNALARRRERADQNVDHLELASSELGAALRLEAEEAVRMRMARYSHVPPRQAVAAWLFHERGWRPREIQALLGVTPSSFRNLRRRAREALGEPPPGVKG